MLVFIGKALIIDDVVPGRYAVSSDGKLFDFKYNRIINGHLNRGYYRVTLMQTNSKQKSYYMHTLVAVMYIEDSREDNTVNHIDGDKLNNDVSNLEWLTHRENMQHAMLTGLLNRKPLFEEDVIKICELRQSGLSSIDISNKLGIHQRTIEGITNGYNWVDISSKYMFPQKAGRVMLSKDKVREVCFMFAKDYTIKEVSDILEIPYPTVSSIRQKVSHKEISDNYF